MWNYRTKLFFKGWFVCSQIILMLYAARRAIAASILLGYRLYQGERRQAGITRETTLHFFLFILNLDDKGSDTEVAATTGR